MHTHQIEKRVYTPIIIKISLLIATQRKENEKKIYIYIIVQEKINRNWIQSNVDQKEYIDFIVYCV